MFVSIIDVSRIILDAFPFLRSQFSVLQEEQGSLWLVKYKASVTLYPDKLLLSDSSLAFPDRNVKWDNFLKRMPQPSHIKSIKESTQASIYDCV